MLSVRGGVVVDHDLIDCPSEQSLSLMDALWIDGKDISFHDAVSLDHDTRLLPHDDELSFDQPAIQNDSRFPVDMQLVDHSTVYDHFAVDHVHFG